MMKRRVALLCCLSRTADAINALVELLEASPTDIEAWAELSDLYLSKGLYSQAEYCLEEVLLVAPNAWNVSFRMVNVYDFLKPFINRIRYMHVWARFYMRLQQLAARVTLLKCLLNLYDAFAGALSYVTATSADTMD